MDVYTKKNQAKRCSKCLLPSSLPGSNFNAEGECAWCQLSFPNYVPMGEEKLHLVLEQNRSRTASADCLVGVSGGKDSSYVLLEMKRKFGMRVEAFTYVHDGLTDFALQNAVEVCKTLDVQHHLVSLPNHAHLESFKAFFSAWVESEDPVAAAMTCVACKHLHILGARLARKRKIPMVIWSVCPLETPSFIPTQQEGEVDAKAKGAIDLGILLFRNLVTQKRFRQAYFGNAYVSFFGCLAFRPESGYLEFRYPSVKHIHFFDYCDWNGVNIVTTLKAHTGWAVPERIASDWHSDCIFNVFKEYMFQKMLGASYTDAFLSNQIRYGLITREQGWAALRRSKDYYSNELFKALSVVGLEHLRSKCDFSCFDITS